MHMETPTRSSSSINASFSRHSDDMFSADESRLKTSRGRDHLALSPPYNSFISPPGRYRQRRLTLTEQLSALESHLHSTPVRRRQPTSTTSSSPRSLVTAATLTEDQSPIVRHVARSFERLSASLDKHQDQETDTDTMVSYPDAPRVQESRKDRAAHSQLPEDASCDDITANSEIIDGNEFQSFTSFVDLEAAAKRRLRSLFSRLNNAADARKDPIPSQVEEDPPLQDLRKVLEEYGIEKARNLSASTPPEDLLDLLYDVTEALRVSAQAMAHERFSRFRWQEKHQEAQQQVEELGQEIRELSADAVSMIQGIDEWRAERADHEAFSQFPRMNSLEAATPSVDKGSALNLQEPQQHVANLQSSVLSELDSNMQVSEPTLLISHSSAQSRQRIVDQLQEDLDVAQVQIGSLQHRLDDALRCDTRDATIIKLRDKVKNLEHLLAMERGYEASHPTAHEDLRTASAHTLLEQSSADYQALVIPLLEQIDFLRTELHAKNDSLDSKLARLPLSEVTLQSSAIRNSQIGAKSQENLAESKLLSVKQGIWESSIKGLLRQVTFLRAKQRRDALFRSDLAFQKHILVAIASQNR